MFLAERALDLYTNALMSIFLRELEHYEGILFLTTNHIQMFDPAILSRIHLPVRFDPLKKEAREAVWRFFITQAMTTAGDPVYDDKLISTLAQKELNGREVRGIPAVASRS